MLGITIRRKARQFGTLVRHSALTARTGVTRKPVLARRGELGVTFIGHSSFFLQIGGRNILVDPNFARWIFILKRLRRPGLKLECPMKVTPNSPRRASTGLRATPVRGVRAERRTKVPNCLALRRIVIPNMRFAIIRR